MATMHYPKGTPCEGNEPDRVITDEDVGLTFTLAKPHPHGVMQREFLVIEAEMHNWDCAKPFRHRVYLTSVQAREVGQWLTKRAREIDRTEFWRRIRSALRIG